MDRLRARQREIDKLEKLFTKSGEEMLCRDFCRKVALSLTRSAGRTGNPIVKWEIWSQDDDFSQLEFEAESSKDGAWYDVDMFLAHRFLNYGDVVRFVGFGAEEDEWINLKRSIRQRSIPFENSECQKVKVGDHVLCFQERVRSMRLYWRPS